MCYIKLCVISLTCVALRTNTLRLRLMASDTVVVSADRRLLISPAAPQAGRQAATHLSDLVLELAGTTYLPILQIRARPPAIKLQGGHMSTSTADSTASCLCSQRQCILVDVGDVQHQHTDWVKLLGCCIVPT